MIILLIIGILSYALSSVLDAVSTLEGVRGGWAKEGNPLLKNKSGGLDLVRYVIFCAVIAGVCLFTTYMEGFSWGGVSFLLASAWHWYGYYSNTRLKRKKGH